MERIRSVYALSRRRVDADDVSGMSKERARFWWVPVPGVPHDWRSRCNGSCLQLQPRSWEAGGSADELAGVVAYLSRLANGSQRAYLALGNGSFPENSVLVIDKSPTRSPSLRQLAHVRWVTLICPWKTTNPTRLCRQFPPSGAQSKCASQKPVRHRTGPHLPKKYPHPSNSRILVK